MKVAMELKCEENENKINKRINENKNKKEIDRKVDEMILKEICFNAHASLVEQKSDAKFNRLKQCNQNLHVELLT